MRKDYTTPNLTANGGFTAHTRTTVPYFENKDGAMFRKDSSFGGVGFGL
jgi:hypothetical protein